MNERLPIGGRDGSAVEWLRVSKTPGQRWRGRAILSAAFVVIALTHSACAVVPRAAPSPTRSTPLSALTALPPATPPPTRPAQIAAPAWWPPDLAMPKTSEFTGDPKRAVWNTRDTNVDGIKDFFLRQSTSAGYQPFVITQSQGAIYDLLFVKGQSAYALNITLGTDSAFLTGSRVGVMHLLVSGAANLEVDLPLRARLDTSAGSEVSIGTSVPSSRCARCEYFVNVHIAPFKGPGNYESRPGIYIIDAQVNPGGDPDKEDYRWAKACSVNVKDALAGSFECKGLENVYDNTKRIDVSGTWQQPP